MAELEDSYLAAVANDNIKVTGSTMTNALASSNALSYINQGSHNRAMDLIQQFMLTEFIGQRAGIDPTEAGAIKKVAEADLSRSLSEQVQQLASAVVTLQAAIISKQP
jgi:hypothetical protein